MNNITDYSIANRVKSELGCIGKIANTFGQMYALNGIGELIRDTALFFNVSRNMTIDQIKETATLILQEYYHLSIIDFKLFFNKIKLGKYGKLYGSFDGANILIALAEYDIERENELIEFRKNQNKQNKEDLKIMDAISNEQLDKLKEKFLVKELPKEKPIQQGTELDIEVKKYMKEFDELYLKSNIGISNGIKILNYNGNMVSVSEYCQLRLNGI